MTSSRPQPGPAGDAATDAALSRDAFGERFASSYRLLWVVAAGMIADRNEAEDVVHEAAVQALGRLDQYRPGTNFNAWMVQIVRYVALNHGRKERRRRSGTMSGEGIESVADERGHGGHGGMGGAGGMESGVIDGRGQLKEMQGQFDDAVTAALGTLSETARACLLLRTVEGLDYREIALMLDIPQGTAMSHVHRSRRQLREKLADVPAGGDSPGDREDM